MRTQKPESQFKTTQRCVLTGVQNLLNWKAVYKARTNFIPIVSGFRKERFGNAVFRKWQMQGSCYQNDRYLSQIQICFSITKICNFKTFLLLIKTY